MQLFYLLCIGCSFFRRLPVFADSEHKHDRRTRCKNSKEHGKAYEKYLPPFIIFTMSLFSLTPFMAELFTCTYGSLCTAWRMSAPNK